MNIFFKDKKLISANFQLLNIKCQLTTVILLFVGGFLSVSAQEVFDLQRCIETGLQRNYSIKIIRNTEQIAANNATFGNAGGLPSVDLSGSYSGTTYDYDYKYTDGTTAKYNNSTNTTIDAGLNMNWTIFDGFGIQADYSKLKELKNQGALNTRMLIEDFVSDVASEYYNLIRQIIRTNNLRSAVVLSKERLRIVEERYYIGSMSRLDLQQAQVDFNADSSELLNQFEKLHASYVRLNELMAIDSIDRHIIIKDSVIYPNPLLEKEKLWENTLAKNTSLLIAESDKNISDFEYKKAKSRNYPYLKLNAGYGYSGFRYQNNAAERLNRPGFNYGITVGIPIFDGMNRRREQRNARLQIENNEYIIEEMRLSLQANMSNFWMAYRNNLELWELEKENLVAAQENYNIAIERYKLGDLSGIELREAQNSLLEAEERRSIAEYNTKICEISLMQLSGQILEYIEDSNKE